MTDLVTIQELSASGRHQECLQACQKALQGSPEESYAYKYAGKSLFALGQFEKAQQCLVKAHQLDGSDPEIVKDIGNIFNAIQRYQEAKKYYNLSLKINPSYAPAINNLGLIAKQQGNLQVAKQLVERATDLDHSFATYHMNLGGIYKELGQLDKALATTLKSLELKPDNPDAHINLSGIYKAMGDMKESEESLQKALAMNPHSPGALYMRSMTLEDANTAHSLLEKIKEVDQRTLPVSDNSKIEFAKSNCLHKQKDYENASIFLKKANELKLLFMPSNAAALIKSMHAIANTLPTKEIPAGNQNCGQIFIVGVPRSGSTLLSAILNTNPTIKDLGESATLQNAIITYLSQGTIGKRQSLGHFYADCIDEAIPPGSITVDKQLYNFIHSHHIVNCMPSAKIIHATRNPLDNILSMLRANLTSGHSFTASAVDSALVIIEQERLMRTFKKIFPQKIYTYSYDKLVNDPQTETRKLLAWLGFDWSASYLDFYKHKQIISTASAMQARQPISNKSVGGWKKYSFLLEPARQLLHESNLFTEESLSQ